LQAPPRVRRRPLCTPLPFWPPEAVHPVISRLPPLVLGGACLPSASWLARACERVRALSSEKLPVSTVQGRAVAAPFCFSFLRGGVLLSLPLIDQTTVLVRKAFRGPVRPPVVRPRPGRPHVPARRELPMRISAHAAPFPSLLLSFFLLCPGLGISPFGVLPA